MRGADRADERWAEGGRRQGMRTQERAAGDGAARILVVEDEALVRTMVCEMLTDAGYDVQEAQSGDEADALMSAGLRIDLLLTDIRMPGTLDGGDLIRRATGRCPALKTVAMSGYAGAKYLCENVADRFIAKPFTSSVLQREIAGVLRAGAG